MFTEELFFCFDEKHLVSGEIRKPVQNIVSAFFVPCLTVCMTIITYLLRLNLSMGAKDDIGRFGGLKDMEHNIGDWDFQRITAALLLPLQ